MNKKISLIILLFVITVFSGCSNDFNKIINDKNNYNKNIEISGEIQFFENGNYYLVDKNNMKIKLIDCSNKYNLNLGLNINLNGFLLKNGNKYSFECKSINKSIQNLTSKIDILNNKIDILNENFTLIKNKKEKYLKYFNNEINLKKKNLDELIPKIDKAKKEKELNLVKSEILNDAKMFPSKPKVVDFQKSIFKMKPSVTESKDTGGWPNRSYYIDIYHKVSKYNSDYTITVNAYRNLGENYYYRYDIIVENNADKYTCTKTK